MIRFRGLGFGVSGFWVWEQGEEESQFVVVVEVEVEVGVVVEVGVRNISQVLFMNPSSLGGSVRIRINSASYSYSKHVPCHRESRVRGISWRTGTLEPPFYEPSARHPLLGFRV